MRWHIIKSCVCIFIQSFGKGLNKTIPLDGRDGIEKFNVNDNFEFPEQSNASNTTAWLYMPTYSATVLQKFRRVVKRRRTKRSDKFSEQKNNFKSKKKKHWKDNESKSMLFNLPLGESMDNIHPNDILSFESSHNVNYYDVRGCRKAGCTNKSSANSLIHEQCNFFILHCILFFFLTTLCDIARMLSFRSHHFIQKTNKIFYM